MRKLLTGNGSDADAPAGRPILAVGPSSSSSSSSSSPSSSSCVKKGFTAGGVGVTLLSLGGLGVGLTWTVIASSGASWSWEDGIIYGDSSCLAVQKWLMAEGALLCFFSAIVLGVKLAGCVRECGSMRHGMQPASMDLSFTACIVLFHLVVQLGWVAYGATLTLPVGWPSGAASGSGAEGKCSIISRAAFACVLINVCLLAVSSCFAVCTCVVIAAALGTKRSSFRGGFGSGSSQNTR